MTAAAAPGCILLVEDDADSRWMLSRLLQLVGHEVVAAAKPAPVEELVGVIEQVVGVKC